MLAGHSPFASLDRPVHQLMTALCEKDPRAHHKRAGLSERGT
jgi:hypothetical protein